MKFVAIVVLAASASAQFQTYTLNGQSNLERLGEDVAFLGDVNGDGYGDFAAGSDSGIVRVYSGFDGSQIYSLTAGSGHPVRALPDLDGDGRADFGVGWLDHGIVVFSGATGTLLFQLGSNLGSSFGLAFDAVGDLDGDGVSDIAIGAPDGYQDVRLFSGKTGAMFGTLHTGVAGFGRAISHLGDVDQDGVDDFLVGATDIDSFHAGLGHVYLYSGATRTILQDWIGPSTGYGYGTEIAVVGDVDGDGFPDYTVDRWTNNGVGTVWPALIDLRSGRSGALLHSLVGPTPDIGFYRNVQPAGDQNGDGIPDLALQEAFRADVEVRSGVDLSLIATIAGPAPYSKFGWGLCAGDTDADGRPEIIVGNWELGVTPQNGYVQIYEMTTPPPTSYCTAKLNSLGCTPTISTQGSSTLSGADDFEIDVAQVLNHKAGTLLFSVKPKALPFGGGTLCIGAPRVVFASQDSGGSTGTLDCSGSYAFQLTHALMQAKGFTPGLVLFFQVHMRDPGFSAPNGVSLTSGLRVTIGP